MACVLITRPAEDAAPLRAHLEQMGLGVITAPMLHIKNIPGPALSLDGVQGFLLTSANGVRALATRTESRDRVVFAVGDATAREARACGFRDVHSADGDVDDLARLVIKSCDPGAGALLHAAGSAQAGDLTGTLERAGYTVRRDVLYQAVPVDSLPAETLEALKSEALDGVLVYSPRTARLFESLISDAGLVPALARLKLFALSRNVNEAATQVWGQRIIAERPDQESLLHSVRTCYY